MHKGDGASYPCQNIHGCCDFNMWLQPCPVRTWGQHGDNMGTACGTAINQNGIPLHHAKSCSQETVLCIHVDIVYNRHILKGKGVGGAQTVLHHCTGTMLVSSGPPRFKGQRLLWNTVCRFLWQDANTNSYMDVSCTEKTQTMICLIAVCDDSRVEKILFKNGQLIIFLYYCFENVCVQLV